MLLAPGRGLRCVRSKRGRRSSRRCARFTSRYDAAEIAGFKSGTLKDLTTEDKVSILFVDGHIEIMTPEDYITRKLFEVPIVPIP